MTRYWPVDDPIDRRIFEAFPDFEGWRTEPRPPPKVGAWSDDGSPSPVRGKMVDQHPVIGRVEEIRHEALTAVDVLTPAPPPSVPAPTESGADPAVPVCAGCGSLINDGRHLVSEAMWNSAHPTRRLPVSPRRTV